MHRVGVYRPNGFIFMGAAWLLFAASQVNGATAPVVGVTKEQAAQIRAIGADLDNRINPILKSDEKLTTAMRDSLVQLVALRSDAERRTAVAAYQQKYLPAYRDVLAKAHVDLNETAKALQAILPNMAFRALPNLVIEGRVHAFAAAHPVTLVGSHSSALTFVDTKSLSCGAIAGGDAVLTSSTIKNNAFAAVLGGCGNTAGKTADFVPPAGATAAQLEASAKLFASAFAAGVIGTAIGLGGVSLIAVSGNSPIGSESSVSAVAAAPVLWSGYVEDAVDATVVGDVPLQSHDSLLILTRTFAVAALPSVATASANVTQIDATLHSQF